MSYYDTCKAVGPRYGYVEGERKPRTSLEKKLFAAEKKYEDALLRFDEVVSRRYMHQRQYEQWLSDANLYGTRRVNFDNDGKIISTTNTQLRDKFKAALAEDEKLEEEYRKLKDEAYEKWMELRKEQEDVTALLDIIKG